LGNAFLQFAVRAHVLAQALRDERGRDLVEYALLTGIVALAAVTGIGTLANGINNVMIALFGTVGNAIASPAQARLPGTG
jgi:Flp pilus assembly pilin Flp